MKNFRSARKTYRGYYLYAVDGDDLNLPASSDVLENDYRGHRYAKGFETYYPKMYTSFAYDILNGLTTEFNFLPRHLELHSALNFVPRLEKKSIAIYDRLYQGYPLMAAHHKAGNDFVIRLKTEGNTALVIRDFLKSGKKEALVSWEDSTKKEEPITIRLVRGKKRNGEALIFATSLAARNFPAKEIANLYRKRWEVEGSFRDLTSTMKAEQWHSKKLNGILQEIYALLWFINVTRIQLRSTEETLDLKVKYYSRSNFKLCAKLFIDNMTLLIRGKTHQLLELLKFWINRTRQKRKHDTRHYARVVKGKLSKFPVHSKIERRPDP